MAKLVKFPLRMADGTGARTLEDLRGHGDMESVLLYYQDGRLARWLKVFGHTELAEKVAAHRNGQLEGTRENLCGVFEMLDYTLPASVHSGAEELLEKERRVVLTSGRRPRTTTTTTMSMRFVPFGILHKNHFFYGKAVRRADRGCLFGLLRLPQAQAEHGGGHGLRA